MARQQVVQGGTQSVDIGEGGGRWDVCQHFWGDVGGGAAGLRRCALQEGLARLTCPVRPRSAGDLTRLPAPDTRRQSLRLPGGRSDTLGAMVSCKSSPFTYPLQVGRPTITKAGNEQA